ncbi:hypothetical protein FisN_13Lh018 [Fistulifera solaris]|uniref:Transmembrane protein n=1 Tax=Fistulifera solaris TaxID=1519565 RepID=A0A1Z5JF16_FISSO|nr:hypothetical protein FisN_13Lh018 [Fistulifera solaris]|eukprot:GAX12569.1 hypothetical protein FisN_13Lh018 [Fistulifera solaris]
MTTAPETNNHQQGTLTVHAGIPSSCCLKQQHQQQSQHESHSDIKPSRVDVFPDGEELPSQPGAVHMIGSRVMTAEQQEEDAWDLEESDEEDDNEEQQHDEERPPSVEELGTVSLHSNRSSACTVEAGNSDDVDPVLSKETYMLPPDIQAEPVDEQQEAKLLEILHAPVVQGEAVSAPKYARYLLPISLTCTFLSLMGIAGMAVFVFVVKPNEVQPIPTPAPTLSPSAVSTLTSSTFFPTLYVDPESDMAPAPISSTFIAVGNETVPPVLPPQSEMADSAPVGTVMVPNGRTTLPPTIATGKKEPTAPPTSLPKQDDTLDTSTSQPSTLAMGFISTLITLSAVVAISAFVAHWQIRKRAQGLPHTVDK